MPTPRPVRLEIPPEALPAVTFALKRTIDDLEARAIVATDHDPDLGPPSAVEYRTDITRLAELLDQLGHTPPCPDPERAAVVWVDGVYTIEQGRPRRMTATARLSELLGEAIDARRESRISPSAGIELVAEATGTAPLETAEQLEAARQIARRAGARPNTASTPHLAGPETTARRATSRHTDASPARLGASTRRRCSPALCVERPSRVTGLASSAPRRDDRRERTQPPATSRSRASIANTVQNVIGPDIR